MPVGQKEVGQQASAQQASGQKLAMEGASRSHLLDDSVACAPAAPSPASSVAVASAPSAASTLSVSTQVVAPPTAPAAPAKSPPAPSPPLTPKAPTRRPKLARSAVTAAGTDAITLASTTALTHKRSAPSGILAAQLEELLRKASRLRDTHRALSEACHFWHTALSLSSLAVAAAMLAFEIASLPGFASTQTVGMTVGSAPSGAAEAAAAARATSGVAMNTIEGTGARVGTFFLALLNLGMICIGRLYNLEGAAASYREACERCGEVAVELTLYSAQGLHEQMDLASYARCLMTIAEMERRAPSSLLLPPCLRSPQPAYQPGTESLGQVGRGTSVEGRSAREPSTAAVPEVITASASGGRGAKAELTNSGKATPSGTRTPPPSWRSQRLARHASNRMAGGGSLL